MYLMIDLIDSNSIMAFLEKTRHLSRSLKNIKPRRVNREFSCTYAN